MYQDDCNSKTVIRLKERIMKKILSLVVLASTVLMLGGCGQKQPTAEELISGAWGSESLSSIDMGMKMKVDANIDMSGFGGSSASGTATMNMALTMDVNLKATEEVAYAEGSMDATLFGVSMSQPLKAYLVQSGDDSQVSYTWNEEDSLWYKSEEETETGNIADMFSADSLQALDSTIFESFELQEPKKDDTVYTVTGLVDYNKMSDTLGVGDTAMQGIMSQDGFDMSDVKFNTTMVFDKETKLCKSIDFALASEGEEAEGTFKEFGITLVINQLNGVEVTVPQDVLDSAVEPSSLDYDIIPNNGDDTATTEESTEQATEEDETLAQYLLNLDYAYIDEVEELLKTYYEELPSDSVITAFCTLVNSYSATEFISYVEAYEFWNENDKDALAVMIDIGIFEISSFESLGVDMTDLQSRVDSFKNK